MQQTNSSNSSNSSSLLRGHRVEIILGLVVTALVLIILAAGWFT
jgi:hypothetical protein